MNDNIHSQTSFSELWAQSSQITDTHRMSHDNTLNHRSHTNTTLHMLRKRLNFTQPRMVLCSASSPEADIYA